MNKLIAFLIGFIIGMGCLLANADVAVFTIGDPAIITYESSNGKKVQYYESRVLISTAKHESGALQEKEETTIKIADEVVADNDSDDVLISVTWEYDGAISKGYNREEYYKN